MACPSGRRGARRHLTFNLNDEGARRNATYNMGNEGGQRNTTYNMGDEGARRNATFNVGHEAPLIPRRTPRRSPGPFNPEMNYSDYVVQEAADLGLMCVPMALFEERPRLGNTHNLGDASGGSGSYGDSPDDTGDPFRYETIAYPSDASHGTYSLINPEFPDLGPIIDSFLEETLEDFGAFHYGVPVNPACSTPQPHRSPSPGLQRTFDITPNVGRPSNTFDVGRPSNTFNVGRPSNTFNVGRPSNTFNVGRPSNTFNVGRASNTFNAGRSSGTFRAAPAPLQHNITPEMNETYEIQEEGGQDYPSDITHGTYSLMYPDVCFPPTPEALFNSTISSGGTEAFFRDVPVWPGQSSPHARAPVCRPARPRQDTFNVGRPSNTFNVGRPSNTFNVGRPSNTFNVGRASNTFNAGRSSGTFRAAPAPLQHNITPEMNETYEIQEEGGQDYPSDITHGTYSLMYPDVCFPPTPEALFNSTISSGGTEAFFRDVPVWPGQSSPHARAPICRPARPRQDTFNVGRPSNTFNVGRPSNTFNVGRPSNTFNVGRASNTFNVGQPSGTFIAAPAPLQHNITPEMNETYEIQEEGGQEYPSDITHGTYSLMYPDVCFPPTPKALFNSTISSGGTEVFFRDVPVWPGQSSPHARTPVCSPARPQQLRSTPRRFIRMDRRYRSYWLPRGTGRRLNFDVSDDIDDRAMTPGSYLVNFNRLSREFVDDIVCDATANQARRRLMFDASGCSSTDSNGGPSRLLRPINQSYSIPRGTVSPAGNVRCEVDNLGVTYDKTDDFSDSDLTYNNYSDVRPSDITDGTYSLDNPEVSFLNCTYGNFSSGVQVDLRSSPRFQPQHNLTHSIGRVHNATYSQARDICPSPASQRYTQSPQAQFTPPSGSRRSQMPACYIPVTCTPQRTAPRERRTQSGSRFRPPLQRQNNFDFNDECDIPINNSRRERSNVSRNNRTPSSRSGNIPNFSLASPSNEPVILDITHRLIENSNSRRPASMDTVSLSLLSHPDSLHADLNNINDILNDEDFVDELIADLSERSVNSNLSNRARSPRNLPANRSFGRIRSPPQRDLGDGFGMQNAQNNYVDQMEDRQYRNFQNVRRQMENVSLRDLEDGLRLRNLSPSVNRRGQRNLHDESNLEQRGQIRDYDDGLVENRSPQANQRGQRRRFEDGNPMGNMSPRANQRGQRRRFEDGYPMGNMSPRANQRGPRDLHDESDAEQRGPRNMHDESDLEDVPLCQRGLRRDLEDGLAVGNMSPPVNQRGQRNLHDESDLEQMRRRRDFEDGLVGNRSPPAGQRGQRNLHDESELEQRERRRDFEDGLAGGVINLHEASDLEQRGPRNLHDQSDLEQRGPRNLHDQSDLEQVVPRNLHDQSDLEQGGPRNLHDQSDLEQGGPINLHDQSDLEQGGPRNLHDQSDLEQGVPRNLHDQSDLEQGGPRNLHDQSDLEQGGRRNLHDQSDLEQGGPRNLNDQSDLEQGGPRNLHDQSDLEQGGPRNLHDQSDLEQGGPRDLHDQSDLEQGGPRNFHDESDLDDVPLCQRGLRRNLEDGLVIENMSPRANQRGQRHLNDESDAEDGRMRNMSPRAYQRSPRNLHNDSSLGDSFGRIPQGGQRQAAENVSINASMYRLMSPAANQRRRRFDERDADGLGIPNRQSMSPQANQRRCRFEEPGPSGLAMQNRQLYISPPGNQRRPRNIHPISPANQRPPRQIPEDRLGNGLGMGNANVSEEMLDDMIEDLIEDISQRLEYVQPGPRNRSLSPPRQAANMSLSPPRQAADMSLSPPRQGRNVSSSPPRQAGNIPASPSGQAGNMSPSPPRPPQAGCVQLFSPRQARNTPNRSVAQARSPPGNRAGPSRNEFPTNEQLISSLLRASANASGIAIPPPTGSPQRDIENLVAHGALDELTMSLVNISLSEDIIGGPNALLEHVSELSFINISTESGEQQQFSILNESIRSAQNVSELLGESPRMLQDESPLCSLNQGGDELLRMEGPNQGPWRVAVQYSRDGEQSFEEYDSFQRIIEELGEQSPGLPANRGPAVIPQHVEEFMANRSRDGQARFTPPDVSTPKNR